MSGVDLISRDDRHIHWHSTDQHCDLVREMNQPPETTEVVARALCVHSTYSDPTSHKFDMDRAELAIAAHRKALSDAGYVEAPVADIAKARAWEDLVRSLAPPTKEKSSLIKEMLFILQTNKAKLGLPIEVER